MRRRKLLTLIGSICLILVLAAMPFLAACPAPPEEVTPTPPEEEEPTPPEEEEVPPPPAPKLPEYLVSLGDDTGTKYVRIAAANDVVERYTGIKMLFQLGRDYGIGIPLLQSGEAHIYHGAMYDFHCMYHGTGDASEYGKTNIRLVMPGMHTGIVWWVTAATQKEHNIKTLADCAGLTKFGLIPGVRLHIISLEEARLEYYNLEDKIVMLPPTGKKQQEEAFQEGRVDIFSTAPRPSLLSVKESVGLFPIPATEGEIEYIIETKGLIWNSAKVLPAGYGGLLDNDLLTIGPLMGIICIQSLSDDTVYAIIKAIYDHVDELIEVHTSFEEQLLEEVGLAEKFTCPYHPGAIKYYKEKGVWTAEMEALQQRLLAEW